MDVITDANIEGMIAAFGKWNSTLTAKLQTGDVSCKVSHNFFGSRNFIQSVSVSTDFVNEFDFCK